MVIEGFDDEELESTNPEDTVEESQSPDKKTNMDEIEQEKIDPVDNHPNIDNQPLDIHDGRDGRIS